jgi:CBS-domain-containing membrane protein
MKRHQVRRLPVVDDAQRLVGLLAQADLARSSDDATIASLLRHISEPAEARNLLLR